MKDDELLARLRATDPGTDLPPADPTRVDRLLEDVRSETDTDTRKQARTPLTWLAAAAAVVRIAVAALVTRSMSEWGVALVLPIGMLMAFALVAAAVGVLAAIMPARRASRLDVLNALQYE